VLQDKLTWLVPAMALFKVGAEGTAAKAFEDKKKRKIKEMKRGNFL